MRHGPTLITLPMLVCTGCEFHAVSGNGKYKVHRCLHAHALAKFIGVADGVYLGCTPETPDWCPCKPATVDCTCGAGQVHDREHAATCAARIVGGEG